MNRKTDPKLKRKEGVVTKGDRATQRQKDLKNAVQTQSTNEGKVPVRIDRRTVILVPASQRSMYERKYRLATVRKPENQEKVAWLKTKGWQMSADGIWINRYKFLHKDFEAALIISKYHLRNIDPKVKYDD